MQLTELTAAAMDSAAASVGAGPVTMVNLLWFRQKPEYAIGFEDARPDVHGAYYEAYAGAFMIVAETLGVEGVEVVFVGSRKAGLVVDIDDDWDDIVIVRYQSFMDFRRIVESDEYVRQADPHRVASVANWRLIVTGTQ